MFIRILTLIISLISYSTLTFSAAEEKVLTLKTVILNQNATLHTALMPLKNIKINSFIPYDAQIKNSTEKRINATNNRL